MAIWRKDEKMYTAIEDLMRKYLMHDHTPSIEQQLRQQFNEYFAWHEENWERGHIESFGGPTGSQLNRYILAAACTRESILRPKVTARVIRLDATWEAGSTYQISI